jgi:hypothetical protein
MRAKKAPTVASRTIDPVETMKAELKEGTEFLRTLYPDDGTEDLRSCALSLRPLFYLHGGSWEAAVAARPFVED